MLFVDSRTINELYVKGKLNTRSGKAFAICKSIMTSCSYSYIGDAGCISSAIQKEDYLSEIEKASFKDINIERTKTIHIPDEVLEEHLDAQTIEKYKSGNVGIYSITVTGVK